MSLFKLSDSLFSVISIGRTFFFFVPSCLLSPKGSSLVLQDQACGWGGDFGETRRVPGTFPPDVCMKTYAV